jgi:integrase
VHPFYVWNVFVAITFYQTGMHFWRQYQCFICLFYLFLGLTASFSGQKVEFITLEEYINEWMQQVKWQVEKSTYRTYSVHCKKLLPVVGHLKLYELDGSKIKFLLSQEFADLAPRTQKNIYSTLRNILRCAIEDRIIHQDVMLGFKLPYVPKVERFVLNREEISRYITVCQGYKYGLVLKLLAITGARLSEIVGLTWDMINFNENAIIINQALDTFARELKPNTKTENSRRMVYLDKETVAQLNAHKKAQLTKKVLLINESKCLVFRMDNGRPMLYSSIYKTHKYVLKKANIGRHIRIHDLRHSVITLLLTEGVPVIQVASLVGQDVKTTTGIYAHTTRRGTAVKF